MARYLLHIALLLLLCGASVPDAAAQTSVRLSDRSITIRGEQYLIHKVRKGETLYAIAKAYAVSQEEIMKANSLTRDVLRNKQTLLIPQKGRKQHTAGTGSSAGEQSPERPEPQIERIRPSIPPKTVERPENPGGQRQPGRIEEGPVVSTRTDTLTAAPDQEGQAFDRNGRLHPFDKGAPMNVAVLLPMQPGMKTNDRFSEYYKGILLGLNALKAEGISVNVRFLNTGASEEKVRGHIRSGALDKANLIIGPVYAEAFGPVAEFGAEKGIPVVSPLGAVGNADNPYVYEAPPAEERSFNRIFEMFGGRYGTPGADANFVLIDHVEHPDTAVLALVEAQLGDKVSTLSFTGVRNQSQAMDVRLNAALDKDRDNIVFVPVNRVDALEGVLSHLSSINTNGRYRITVIGTPRWEWLPNINLDLFYKLNVHYPASYHADRSDPAVAEFYREYIDSFGGTPSPYAFRGYDVIRYFAGALKHFGPDMPDRIANRGYDPQLLQVGYDFRQSGNGNGDGKHRNVAWPIVNFRPDYSIQVIR